MIEQRRIESELGTWIQAHWTPGAQDALAGVVERIWDFEGTLAAGREQVFPDRFGRDRRAVGRTAPSRSRRSGRPVPGAGRRGVAHRKRDRSGPQAKCRVLGIRLHPSGAFAVLRNALRELTDRNVDLRDAVGSASEELGARLADGRDGRARIAAALVWIRRRVAVGPEFDPLVERVLRSIDRDGGAASIAELEELAGRSRSRFAATFRDRVGVSPKRYARIVRFRRALTLLGAGPRPLHAVALEAGYYDQAHFTVEFREHAGLTPSDYLRAMRYPYSDHLTLPV